MEKVRIEHFGVMILLKAQLVAMERKNNFQILCGIHQRTSY